jgi:hypothetical protein
MVCKRAQAATFMLVVDFPCVGEDSLFGSFLTLRLSARPPGCSRLRYFPAREWSMVSGHVLKQLGMTDCGATGP